MAAREEGLGRDRRRQENQWGGCSRGPGQRQWCSEQREQEWQDLLVHWVCGDEREKKEAWMPAPPTSALGFGEVVWWLGDHYHCWVGSSWPIFSMGHQYPPVYCPRGLLEI